MAAFAANSLLCRVALRDGHVDPASFGVIRVTAGALVLAVALRLRSRPAATPDWRAAVMLFAYVAAFSFAYLTLSAGTGALILFGAVQLTMFAVGLAGGERFAPAGWAGLALAAAGLVVLVLPGVAAPPLAGAALMAVAGAAWGAYSLRGRGVPDPLAATASNFLRALPLALLLGVAFGARAHADAAGIALAIASGALTSGLGYVIWYAALRGLSALQAASVQLSVPVIAACGGTLWLDEPFTPRLAVAVVAILGGIALVLTDRARKRG
ncbi:DMT family transporter [Massilia rhizosphaerae]|uniref:DMT family transporter n=1 Tax=Massilia rhizosphaerae TaxID=2784389 RepID=UPI0018DB7C43|nr:DMT family transporter [Massilia rhizosphaerae]